MGYEDKPVGYDGARLMIEHELTGLCEICAPSEIGIAIYDYYLQTWINPQYKGYRAEAALDVLQTHLPSMPRPTARTRSRPRCVTYITSGMRGRDGRCDR